MKLLHLLAVMKQIANKPAQSCNKFWPLNWINDHFYCLRDTWCMFSSFPGTESANTKSTSDFPSTWFNSPFIDCNKKRKQDIKWLIFKGFASTFASFVCLNPKFIFPRKATTQKKYRKEEETEITSDGSTCITSMTTSTIGVWENVSFVKRNEKNVVEGNDTLLLPLTGVKRIRWLFSSGGKRKRKLRPRECWCSINICFVLKWDEVWRSLLLYFPPYPVLLHHHRKEKFPVLL